MNHFLKFWGTRGSCAVSGRDYQHFGGNTVCLEVRYGDTLAIIDAGTGIRPLGIQLLKENIRKIDLFLSHTHWDHVAGLPFFDPIHSPEIELTIWTPHGDKEPFKKLFAPDFFPVSLSDLQANLQFLPIREKTVQSIGALEIDCHRVNHPGFSVGFKIKTPCQTIGYVTDNELSNDPHASMIDFYQSCDLFIHEAQYNPEEYLQKENWGHSSFANVVSFIQKIRPKKWLVTHHDPKHTDADLQILCRETKKLLRERKISCPVQWIGDGYKIELL